MSYCMYCMEPMQSGVLYCPTCGKQQAYDCPENFLRPGTLLNGGRYLIGAAIGEGGFGITYMARDLRLDMTVAVKEFYPDGYVNRDNAATCNITATVRNREFFEKGKAKFLDEARILASLHDAVGIVDVRDFFEENNTTYIVMEFLNGETLKERLKKVGRLPYEEVYQLLLPVMHSLIIVHDKGVIHRDISPDNIMLAKNGVKLLDFGAAREAFSDDERSYSVLLKRGYSPVEQYTKKNQGPWTDVYALCATMYRCITGVVPTEPFLRETEPLRAPSALGVPISPQFEQALMTGLAMFPEQRYQNMGALIAAFDAALRGVQPPRTVATAAQPTPEMHTAVSQPPIQTPYPKYPPQQAPDQTVAVRKSAPAPQPKKGGAGKWIALALVILVVIGGAGFFVWKTMQPDGKKTPAQTNAAIPIVIDTGEAPEDTKETSTTQMTAAEPPTAPQTSPQGYPSTAAVGSSGTYRGLDELLNTDWPGNSHQLSYDEKTGSLCVWLVLPQGTYVGLRNRSETTLKTWDGCVAYSKSLSSQLKKNFEIEGFSDISCTVGLLNDTDLDSYLFKCTDGAVIYDAIDGVEYGVG